MPRRTRALSVCLESGCPEFATRRGRCDEHRRDSEARQRQAHPRPSSRQAGYDSTWERTRRDFIEHFDRCFDCGARDVRLDVHHVDALGPKGPRGHDWMNLLALCHSCHSRRTRLERKAP